MNKKSKSVPSSRNELRNRLKEQINSEPCVSECPAPLPYHPTYQQNMYTCRHYPYCCATHRHPVHWCDFCTSVRMFPNIHYTHPHYLPTATCVPPCTLPTHPPIREPCLQHVLPSCSNPRYECEKRC